MLDRFNRKINYLRISVTDRCNLRCLYCMPTEGVTLVSHEGILSFEEIFEITKTAVTMGIDKVRLTGGEPLVRHDIVKLIGMLSTITGIKDFAMTTNGILLAEYADSLAEAGLDRINISLDALSPWRYRQITRGGDVNRVLAGIQAAKAAGLAPVRLNCVINQSIEEPDAKDVAAFARANGLEVRFIRKMDLAAGSFWHVEGGTGGHCKLCNRLRLSSEGFIRPCLFSDLTFNVRELGAAEAIKMALQAKPESGEKCLNNTFYGIGG